MIYIAFSILTLLILAFAFYEWQFYMVFTPTYFREGELCERCSLLSMQTDDGVELEGIIYEPQNAKSTLLFFAGRSHDVVGIASKLAATYPSSRVVAFNYRSYGKSEGRISEKSILSDALKIAALIEKNYGSFYLLGFSLGASVAAYVAKQHKVQALFLVGAFESIASLAKQRFSLPDMITSKLLRYKFQTGKYVSRVTASTYLFASKHDEVTYIENARALKERVKNLTYYEELENLSHKEILWDKRVTEKINGVMHV